MRDIHEEIDDRNVPLRVGVCDVVHPVRLETGVDRLGRVAVSVDLKHRRGIHMSRIPQALQSDAYNPLMLTPDVLFDLADVLEYELKTSNTFVSVATSWDLGQGLYAGIRADVDANNIEITMTVPVFTVCPCSLEACQGKAAHTQRCELRGTVRMSEKYADMDFDALGQVLISSGSSEVYPLLKRDQEKALVEHGFENPKFVEDVVRDALLGLREVFEEANCIVVQALSSESIHPHNVHASAKWRCNEDQAQITVSIETKGAEKEEAKSQSREGE